jgi:hypothetical protein
MPLDQVEEELKKLALAYAYKARLHRPIDSNEVRYTILGGTYFVEKQSFTLIVKPYGNKTIISMDELPADTTYYFLRVVRIIEKMNLQINAPKIYEDDKDFVAAGLPPAPKPKKMTAKKLLAEYRRRKRKDKELTLKAFCEQTGHNYDSIKSAKYRIEKLKEAHKKS